MAREDLADRDDDRVAALLTRLGVDTNVTARLRQYAKADGERLRDLVVYVLSDYAPPVEKDGGEG